MTNEETNEEASEVISGIKLIKLTGQMKEISDEPSMPFKLEMGFSPPQFMEVTWCFIHGGTQELLLRGETREGIEEFLRRNHLRRHPRLLRFTISGPEGVIERYPPPSPQDSSEISSHKTVE